MTRLGLVMGLQAEADCLRACPGAERTLIYVSGGSALRARIGAEQLRARGVDGLVSFGLAIGLAPVLRPGDLVLAESVVLPSGAAIATDAPWRAALRRRLASQGLDARVARIVGSDEPLSSVSAKRTVFQTTIAAALDTESHAVAEVATAAGLPFLVLRAVAEPAESTRPAVAFAPTTPAGHTRRLAVFVQLLLRPWEIPIAWQFSTNRRLALDALRRVAAVDPAGFGFRPG